MVTELPLLTIFRSLPVMDAMSSMAVECPLRGEVLQCAGHHAHDQHHQSERDNPEKKQPEQAQTALAVPCSGFVPMTIGSHQ